MKIEADQIKAEEVCMTMSPSRSVIVHSMLLTGSRYFRVSLFLLLTQMIVVGLFYYDNLALRDFVTPIHTNKSDLTGIANGIDVNLISQYQDIVTGTNSSQGLEYCNVTLKASVAVGMGLTTRSQRRTDLKGPGIVMLPFFKSLLHSFCRTSSQGYHYQFYLAYDYNDDCLAQFDCISHFTNTFTRFTKTHCPGTAKYSIHFVQCNHTGKPAWAQNDAMIEAYLSGVDYMYRINDDTILETAGWTERFIDTLERLNPPRVGVVGPTHEGGNPGILTYDFTHRTHVEIHGFYYPRYFKDWFGDRWVTEVYKPSRSLMLPDVKLVHTMEKGHRYEKTKKLGKIMGDVLRRDRDFVIRYAIAAEAGFGNSTEKLVIAMSLVSTDPAHMWGVVRNAQLAPVIFTGWTLHVYTSYSFVNTSQVNFGHRRNDSKVSIPGNVIRTLKGLGARIVYVDAEVEKSVPPSLWHYLVADDPEVEVFVVRNATGRLSQRDYETVKHWMVRKKSKAIQCIRDHPKHVNKTMIDGLWGAKTEALKSTQMYTSMRNLLKYTANASLPLNTTNKSTFLNRVFYPKLRGGIEYYDSIHCDKPDSLPFPIERTRPTYIGQQYDSHEQLLFDEKRTILASTNPDCEPSL